jgi:hypothetical protein
LLNHRQCPMPFALVGQKVREEAGLEWEPRG